jgi:hypothetical protein
MGRRRYEKRLAASDAAARRPRPSVPLRSARSRQCDPGPRRRAGTPSFRHSIFRSHRRASDRRERALPGHQSSAMVKPTSSILLRTAQAQHPPAFHVRIPDVNQVAARGERVGGCACLRAGQHGKHDQRNGDAQARRAIARAPVAVNDGRAPRRRHAGARAQTQSSPSFSASSMAPILT